MNKNNNKIPEIITYVSSVDHINEALDSGATHLILEDSKCSIRSWSDQFNDSGFSHLHTLYKAIKAQSKQCKISLQCDVMMHQKDICLIEQLIHETAELQIEYVRVQDPGVMMLYKEKRPEQKCCFIQDMGNANSESMLTYSQYMDRQQLSLDITKEDIQKVRQEKSIHYECMVQGPILIQHSQRRYLAGLAEKNQSDAATIIHRIAEDEDYPGRRFTFYDNPHGHFMYAYFDRCLIRNISDLLDLNCEGWIIDARGQSMNYLNTAIHAYAKAAKNETTSSADATRMIQILREECGRAQKPGFFKANLTDKQRYNTHLPNEIEYEKIGRVLDIKKGSRITIEVNRRIEIGDQLSAFHPKCDGLQLPVTQMWAADGNPLTTSSTPALIQIPWKKGIQQHAIIYKVKGD